MWKIIVDLLEKWWKDKPRKDVVRAIVRLRDAMRECQSSYQKFKSAEANSDVEDLPYPTRNIEWRHSVTHLARALARIDNILAVFSPQARSTINYYLGAEAIAADAILDTAAEDLKQPLEIDIDEGTINARFFTALEELDAFIRTNFKIEEIHAAQNGNW